MLSKSVESLSPLCCHYSGGSYLSIAKDKQTVTLIILHENVLGIVGRLITNNVFLEKLIFTTQGIIIKYININQQII